MKTQAVEFKKRAKDIDGTMLNVNRFKSITVVKFAFVANIVSEVRVEEKNYLFKVRHHIMMSST